VVDVAARLPGVQLQGAGARSPAGIGATLAPEEGTNQAWADADVDRYLIDTGEYRPSYETRQAETAV